MSSFFWWRLSFIAICVLGLILPVQAETGTISGRIFNSGEPLAFIQIGIPALGVGVASDENGFYRLTNIPLGWHVLKVVGMGFEMLEDSIEMNHTNPDLIKDYNLLVEAYTLEEIVVVDQQTGLSSRTPYNITTLDAKAIQLKGNPSGLMGFIREEPGVYGAEFGQGIVKPFIRGLGFSRVVTIYQGAKLENHQWGADHGLGVNDLGVGMVDIIKGPASILYGSGAIGGVVIVKDDEGYTAQHQWTGNLGMAFNSASMGLRPYGTLARSFSNAWFIAADAAYDSHADYVNGDGRMIGNSRFNTQTYRVHLGVNKLRFKNKLSYTFHNQELGIIEEDEMDDAVSLATSRSDRRIQLPFQSISDHIISYKQTTVHKRLITATTISHQINSRKEIEEAFDATALGLLQSNTFFNFRITQKAGERLENTFGVQGAFIYNRNMRDALEILMPDARILEVGAYYLAGITLSSYYLQAGVRYDYRVVNADASSALFIDYGFELPSNPTSRKLQRSFSGFTGSLGVSKFLRDHTFKLNLSTGFRAPDLAELFSFGPHPGTNRFEVGNADFGREQSFQADINWVFTHPRVRAHMAIFSNVVDNYLYFAYTGENRISDGLEIWAFLQARGVLYGSEMAVTGYFLPQNRLALSANASFIRGKRLDNSEDLTFVPADNFSFKLDIKPFKKQSTSLTSTFRIVAAQNRPGLNELTTPRYSLWHLGAHHTFQFKKQSLATGIHVTNLLGNTYVDHMSILRAFNVSGVGRNVMLSLQYRW
jgi:iron complex outermembrane recepter protein